MVRGLETVNISKAASTTNLFYLFFHGGKAAIIPFLTLFYRLIGLTALEAGGIIAAKTVTGLIWAPLWSRCATAHSRHRLVLLFSLFMMLVTYLSFPALYTQLSKPEHCNPNFGINDSMNLQQNMSGQQESTFTTKSPDLQKNTTLVPPLTTPRVTQLFTLKPPEMITNAPPATKQKTPAPATTQQVLTTENNLGVDITTLRTRDDNVYVQVLSVMRALNIGPEVYLDPNLTDDQFYELIKQKLQGNGTITRKQAALMLTVLKANAGSGEPSRLHKRAVDESQDNKESEESMSWTSTVKNTLHSIQNSLQNDRLLLFLVVLAITVCGEIFASPVEKVADDAWFDFLNRIDDLERYGQQRFWGSLAFVVIPIVVTITVDHTPCFLPFHLHHYLLHFYIFAVLTGAALIVACCYPVPPPANGKYMSKVCKGLRVICCDGRGFLFAVTLLITGMIYAAFHNFLFWRIQDLGGSETTMGLCVSIGAFAEMPMLILSQSLVKKLGHSWMVCISLFALSMRVLYYAFIPEPWAFLPIELTHGITHTALWFAILSYDDFNVGAAVDRSIRTILSSFYFGIGFSSGSVVAGYIFNVYGSSVLFWGCSAVTGGWCLLFALVQRCLPQKEKVRYIKLLRSDSDNSDDEDDDWLEMALKDH